MAQKNGMDHIELLLHCKDNEVFYVPIDKHQNGYESCTGRELSLMEGLWYNETRPWNTVKGRLYSAAWRDPFTGGAGLWRAQRWARTLTNQEGVIEKMVAHNGIATA